MIVNPLIKKTFEEISKASIEYANTPDLEKKYLIRLLKVFNRLEEDEQVYILRTLLEHIHFRSILTDPDNIFQIYNIKLRTITYIFILAVVFLFLTSALLQTNDSINELLKHISNIFEIVF